MYAVFMCSHERTYGAIRFYSLFVVEVNIWSMLKFKPKILAGAEVETKFGYYLKHRTKLSAAEASCTASIAACCAESLYFITS